MKIKFEDLEKDKFYRPNKKKIEEENEQQSIKNLLNDLSYRTETEWTPEKVQSRTAQKNQQISYVQSLINNKTYSPKVGNLVLKYLEENPMTKTKDKNTFNKNIENWINQNVTNTNINNIESELQNFNSYAEAMRPIKPEQHQETGVFKKSEAYNNNNTLWDKIISTAKTVGSTTGDIGLNIVKGLGNVAEGIGDLSTYGVAQIQDWTGNKKKAEENRRFAKKDTLGNWMKPAIDTVDKNSVIGDFGDSIPQGIGYMSGLWAGGGIGESLGGTIGGTTKAMQVGSKVGEVGTMITSSFGSGMTDAYNKGATNKQAWASGLTNALIETASEELFGVFGKVDTKLVNKIASRMGTGMGKVFTRVGLSGIGEGLEEVISYGGNYIVNKIIQNTVDKDKNVDLAGKWDWEDLGKQFASAFLTASLTGGGNTALGIAEGKQTGLSFKQALNQYATNLDIQSVKEDIQYLSESLEKETDNAKRKEIKQQLKWKQQQLMSMENKNSNTEQQKQVQNIVNQKVNSQNQDENIQGNEKTIEGNKDITQEVKLPLKRFTRTRDINNNLTTTQNQNKSFEDILDEAMNNYEDVAEIESPLKNRDINTIGKETKRNAYQYENPNVKPYFQDMAQMIGEDLAYVSSSDNRSSQKGGGTKLSATTKAMDILHNEQGYSYDQIAKGLENIIEDNGKENNAISKKLELIIDDQLRNGYTNALGKNIEPNQEYINTIQQGQEIQESQENQQIQEVQLPIKEKKKIRLPIKQEANINQEQNQVKAKDTNEVMNEVQKYIKNNDLDMTTNEFVEWASNVELENEENMTQEQKELYSLISDIQNRTNSMYNEKNVDFDKNTYLDYNNKEKNITDSMLSAYSVDNRVEEYFKYNHTDKFYNLTYEEMEKASSIVSDRISENNNGIANDDKYIYYYDSENNDAKNYTITDIEEIDKEKGDLINERSSNSNNRRTISIRNGQDVDIRNNKSNKDGRTSNEVIQMDSTKQGSDSKGNVEQSTSNSTVKNSKESSFSFNITQDNQKNVADKELESVDIETFSTDSYEGQTNFVKQITDKDGNVIAKLEYAYYDGQNHVQMIEVEPEYRRKGLAKKLLQDLQAETPDKQIMFGMTTPDGTKLIESVTEKTKNPVYNEKKAKRINKLEQQARDLRQQIEDYNDKLKSYAEKNKNGTITEEEMQEWRKLSHEQIELMQKEQDINEKWYKLEQKANVDELREFNTFVKQDNKNFTDSDIRYDLEDHSDNTAENEIQRKINRSMTMKEAEDMIQRAFVTGKIYDSYDGKYKNGNEWLQGEGAEDVSMWIENDYNLQQKYINSNEEILNEEYTIDDVIEAYQNKTLTGNEKKQTQRLDTSKDTGYKDKRFFAPREATGGKELYDLANQRVTNNNRNEVYKARADFIINAHNEGYVNELGLTQKEVNEKLRKWANYPLKARNISGYINKGVATENKWVGIENSSIVNKLSVSTEQLDSLVKEVKGTSDDYQRKYIVDTMLALDTHLDYKGLTYDFAPDVEGMGESALADYSSKNDTIRVKRDGLNTIAHETGHYIDHLLGREIGNGYDLGLTSLCREYSNKNLSEQQKQFLSNFNNFLNSIEDVSDIGSTYKMSSNEVFARFVARFVEWTRNTATGNRYGYEAKWYNDNFIQPQYVEFAKLLQEYSLLKTTNQVSDKRIKSDNRIYEQRISDIYEELNKKKKTKVNFDNEVMKTNSELKGNSETDEKIAKILTEPQKNVKPEQRTWAVLKANLIDKGAVFEKLSQQTKNRDLQGKYDFTLSAGSRGQNAIGNARYEFDSKSKTKKQISKSLTDIIDEVGDNTEDFYNYMYHQLNIDRMTLEDRFDGDTGTNYERTKKVENKPVFGKGVTAEISEKVVKNLESKHPEFKKYAKDVYDYLDANTKELVDNGVISKETQELFKEMYPHYVPISRVIYNNQAIGVPLDTNRTGINSPIKKATGGHTDINPLFQTMADRTLQTYTASARNSFGVELKNTLAKLNQLNTNTEVADIDSIMDSMTQEEQNNELLQKGKNGENPTFTVFENGNKITYEISQDMYDALKPKNELLKKLDNTKVSEVAKKISNFRRGVLTEYNPIFSITNAVKDAQDVLINSQHSAKTYSKFPEAYAQIMKKGYWYNEYVQNGGEQNSYFTEGEFENLKKKSKAKNILTFPLKKISDINNVIEMAPRLAEYIASREKGASIESAMLDASRVTTNFKAGGDLTKFANRNGATFLNASVQGFQQQVRNIQEANMKGLKGWTSLATKYTIAGLPVLLLNNLFWDDDDDYNQLQDYVKDNYYVVAKLPNGNFLRVPKGRMVATIQKVVSNVNDFVKEGNMNPDSVASTIWKDLKEDITFGMDNLAPNNPVKNNILSPIFDVINNKTWYGGDMIPSRLKDVPEAEQYDESTDKLSKWIGEKTGKSPIKINYLLDQYSGGLGDVLLPMGTPQAENNVFEDKFTTNPTMKSQYPTDFFTKADELKIKNNSAKVTDEDQLKYKFFSNVQKDVSDLYKQKREIQLSDKTDEEKKKELNTIQKQINKLAKEGLENVDKLKISGNYATVGEKEYYKVNGKWNELNEKDKIDGVSLKTYSSYQNSLQKEKENLIKSGELKEGKGLTDNQKNKVLLDSNYTKKEKQAIYSNTTGKNDELYNNLSKLTDVNIDAYLDFKLQNIKGEEDKDSEIEGVTKSGSKKKNFVNYLNNADFSRVERLYIYGKNYKYNQTERDIMDNYIQKANLTSEEKKSVYEGLTKNVEKHKDGKYYWKK